MSSRVSRMAQRIQKGRLISSLDAKERENRERLQKTEDRAFELIEKQWKGWLRGRKIPDNLRNSMRNEPAFQRLVLELLANPDVTVQPDLDHTPIVERQPDGSVTNLLVEQFGEDPRLRQCPRCTNETDQPGRECPACREFDAHK